MQPYRGTPLKGIEEEPPITPKGRGHRRHQATDTLPLLNPLVRSGSPCGLPTPGSPTTPPRYIGKGKAPEQQQQQTPQTASEDDEARCRCRFPLEASDKVESLVPSRGASPVTSRSSSPVLNRRPSQEFGGSYGLYQKVSSYLPSRIDRTTLRIHVSAASTSTPSGQKFKVYRCILVHAGDMPLLVGENSNQPRLAFQSLSNMAYAERITEQGEKNVWPKEWWQLEEFEDRCSACELKRTEGAAAPKSPLWIRQSGEDLLELKIAGARCRPGKS